jgi:hypothetical protein
MFKKEFKKTKEVRHMFRSKKAQSTLEYIIIFTAIVAVVIAAANGIIKTKMAAIMNHAAEQAETAVAHINFE